jgi:uncharacterized membrane protein YtjA (UPF0391 family)
MTYSAALTGDNAAVPPGAPLRCDLISGPGARRHAEIAFPQSVAIAGGRHAIAGITEGTPRARLGSFFICSPPIMPNGQAVAEETSSDCRKPPGCARRLPEGEMKMLGWALVFLVVALIAGLFGFTGIAVASAGIAQILFYIFVALFIISGLVYLLRGRAPPPPV